VDDLAASPVLGDGGANVFGRHPLGIDGNAEVAGTAEDLAAQVAVPPGLVADSGVTVTVVGSPVSGPSPVVVLLGYLVDA
jgi:hypothetical protein